jgi:hypothetical protein
MKRIYTVQVKAVVHTVRTYKKFAGSIDEARTMVIANPDSFLEEEKIYSELNTECRPNVFVNEEEQELT